VLRDLEEVTKETEDWDGLTITAGIVSLYFATETQLQSLLRLLQGKLSLYILAVIASWDR